LIFYREEIDHINKDNDNLEFELRTETDKVTTEVKNRKKLERVLKDAAGALKMALRVRLIIKLPWHLHSIMSIIISALSYNMT
jgi:hypothetical protein